MAPTHAGQSGRVIVRRLGSVICLGAKQMPGHHGRARGYRHAVDKIPARDLAIHPQFPVPWIHDRPRLEFPRRPEDRELRTALRFLHREFGALEADTAVGSVAEGLVDRATAAAEGKCGFASEVVCSAICVHEFDGSLGSFHAIRPVWPDSNLDLSHEEILQPYGFLVSLKKISLSPGESLGASLKFRVSSFEFQVSSFEASEFQGLQRDALKDSE